MQSSVIQVKRGKQWRPPRVLVYGEQKVGKTTFASGAKDVVFIGPEDGAGALELTHFPTPASWADVLEQVNHLEKSEHEFKAVCLDTLDWLEPLLWAEVCRASNKRDIEEFGYGKGYDKALDEWRSFMARLERVRARGVAVICLAHASVRTFQDPSGPDFDRWELKLNKKAAGLFVEWVDVVGFARIASAVDKSGKARSTGARELHTRATPAFLAGTRFDIPSPMPLDWGQFAKAVHTAWKGNDNANAA